MSKNVLIISSSPRRGSNSEALCRAFAEGAECAGHHVELISLREKNISFCRGCLACVQTQRCVIADDAREIADKMLRADVLVFATPIYYYEMSGQLKTLLDRMNPLYSADYAFRDVYMLTTAAEDDERVPERAEAGLTGWTDCFPRSRLAGTVFAGGVTGTNEMAGHPALDKARELGRNI